MNGEEMFTLKWMEEAGYIIDRDAKTIIRVPEKTRKHNYLEHVAEKYRWKISTVSMTVRRRRKVKLDELAEREHIIETARIRRMNEELKKWKQEKEAAWDLCKKASPTKVVAYNLGTCPMTEREQALLQYYLVAWRPPRGIGG